MQQEITKLIQDCLLFFSSNCYTRNRIDKYRSLWKYGILRYMKEKKLSLYTQSLGQEYITDCIPCDNLRHDDREKIRSIQVLDDYLNLGYIRKRTIVPVKHTLEGEIGLQMQKLIDHLQSLRRSSVTIKDYELYLNRFLVFLNQSGVYSMNGIREHHILEFLSTTENNKINVASSLRVLFRFWFESHITDGNFEDILRSYKWVKREKIPSFFTTDEVRDIEESIDKSSGVGKRNYAMLLLASRLGLRASDVANLKFSNIDWDKNEIKLTQYKTGHPIILPLLNDIGNAIIDYLRYGRFKSESQNVFISSRAPYVPANKSIVCSAIREIISQSKVNIDGRRHGPHSLRHSLASCLLKNETPIHVISEALGHTKTDTTLTYLRIDLTSLLKCAITVPYQMNFMPRKEEFFMSKHFEYKSVLASDIKDFIHMKEASGCNFLRGKWILFEIDRFFQENSILEPSITREIVREWRKSRANDSPATIYSKYSIISQLARYMSRQGRECFIPRLPEYGSSKWNFTPYIFTHKQIDQLFYRSNQLRMYDRHMSNTMFCVPAVLRLIYSTGLRVSEALSIKNADIKFDQRHILIRKTKNGCERIVPINDRLREVLQQYANYRDRMPVRHVSSPNSFFFIKSDGSYCNAQSIYKWFRRLLAECNIPYVGNHHGPRVHDLRHTFAVHSFVQMAKNGMDLYSSLPVISACLGHKSLSATEQYVRLTSEMYPELVEQCSPINAFVYPKI